jgi:TPR repeat protein
LLLAFNQTAAQDGLMENNPSAAESDQDASFEPAMAHSQRNTEQLAEGGDPEAQFRMGLAQACHGTLGGFSHAAEWYRKAADQGHTLAQFNLGVMYGRGQGFGRDRERSRFWLTRAAEAGDAGAQYMLGMTQNRTSLDEVAATAKESRIEAYKWLQLAAAQGYGEAPAGCDLVSMGMTVEGVKEGKRRASVFIARVDSKAC